LVLLDEVVADLLNGIHSSLFDVDDLLAVNIENGVGSSDGHALEIGLSLEQMLEARSLSAEGGVLQSQKFNDMSLEEWLHHLSDVDSSSGKINLLDLILVVFEIVVSFLFSEVHERGKIFRVVKVVVGSLKESLRNWLLWIHHGLHPVEGKEDVDDLLHDRFLDRLVVELHGPLGDVFSAWAVIEVDGAFDSSCGHVISFVVFALPSVLHVDIESGHESDGGVNLSTNVSNGVSELWKSGGEVLLHRVPSLEMGLSGGDESFSLSDEHLLGFGKTGGGQTDLLSSEALAESKVGGGINTSSGVGPKGVVPSFWLQRVGGTVRIDSNNE